MSEWLISIEDDSAPGFLLYNLDKNRSRLYHATFSNTRMNPELPKKLLRLISDL